MRGPSEAALNHTHKKNENTAYILVLIASSLLNLTVNSVIYNDTHKTKQAAKVLFPAIEHALDISSFLLVSVFALLGIYLLQSLLRHHHKTRKSMLGLGICSALYLAINLLTIGSGIYIFNIQSYLLLAISICVYFSVNTTFLFWYWYIDYPTQLRKLNHPETQSQLEFPKSQNPENPSTPSFLDYLYFTVTTSNTLGPAENHSPNGSKAKGILMLHSVTMMILLVIFMSRAINTLS